MPLAPRLAHTGAPVLRWPSWCPRLSPNMSASRIGIELPRKSALRSGRPSTMSTATRISVKRCASLSCEASHRSTAREAAPESSLHNDVNAICSRIRGFEPARSVAPAAPGVTSSVAATKAEAVQTMRCVAQCVSSSLAACAATNTRALVAPHAVPRFRNFASLFERGRSPNCTTTSGKRLPHSGSSARVWSKCDTRHTPAARAAPESMPTRSEEVTSVSTGHPVRFASEMMAHASSAPSAPPATTSPFLARESSGRTERASSG
mmetsp:Transcript_5678/g.22408  ORF Transcript_5678/g.22408 Transcript_5678/m.22408 type:complete len:264 (-) Transcript_5678:163-954(-)